jgi:MFS family permease
VIGFAFATNTAMIVAGQLLVLRRLEGHRRSSALALVALIWGGSWLILGSAGLVPPGILRALLICTCAAVFGLGETLFSPVNPAITNDLAPERLRGRYNAVTSLTWNVAFSLGPAFAGLLLGRDLPAVWVAILVGGCLVAAVLARTLDGVLTPEQNGVRPAGRPSEVLPAVPAAASIGGTGANPKP